MDDKFDKCLEFHKLLVIKCWCHLLNLTDADVHIMLSYSLGTTKQAINLKLKEISFIKDDIIRTPQLRHEHL